MARKIFRNYLGCTLEVIKEETELEYSYPIGEARGKMMGTTFKPFLSSWSNKRYYILLLFVDKINDSSDGSLLLL